MPMGVYSNPTQVMKRSRAFRRPYPAKASTPRNNPNRIAIAIKQVVKPGGLSQGWCSLGDSYADRGDSYADRGDSISDRGDSILVRGDSILDRGDSI